MESWSRRVRTCVGGAWFAVLLATLALASCNRQLDPDAEPDVSSSRAVPPAIAPENPSSRGFIHGRVTTHEGAAYEGRLRWGYDQEAFWGHSFNGRKHENPWASHVPAEHLARQERGLEIFGRKFFHREHQVDLGRPFMARFGDISRVERTGNIVQVTLKSGTVFSLDRLEANDFDDGVRVWDRRHGVVDLADRWIRSIDFFDPPEPATGAPRLYGTVLTRAGRFTGFIQWDRRQCVGTDELVGRRDGEEIGLRFDSIRSIVRHSHNSSLVRLLDGRELVLSDTRGVGSGNQGVFVDDPRYRRVLASWNVFERLDLSAGGSGPSYGDYGPGRPLTGKVTTRDGSEFTGRLVFDLDESETTETLDAPFLGVSFTIPFGLIHSIVAPDGSQPARVTLHGGEQLQLEADGDLGDANAGMLIFIEGRQRPRYVRWSDLERIELNRS